MKEKKQFQKIVRCCAGNAIEPRQENKIKAAKKTIDDWGLCHILAVILLRYQTGEE